MELPNNSIIEFKNLDRKLKESIESFDEPYSDPSTLPSYLISKEISKITKSQYPVMEEMNYFWL